MSTPDESLQKWNRLGYLAKLLAFENVLKNMYLILTVFMSSGAC